MFATACQMRYTACRRRSEGTGHHDRVVQARCSNSGMVVKSAAVARHAYAYELPKSKREARSN